MPRKKMKGMNYDVGRTAYLAFIQNSLAAGALAAV